MILVNNYLNDSHWIKLLHKIMCDIDNIITSHNQPGAHHVVSGDNGNATFPL